MGDESILDSTKRLCGIDPADDSYDLDFIAHINSVFFVFTQLGVGPKDGFLIFDKTTKWSEFMQGEYLAPVISLMGISVRLLFDPPQTGPATEAMERRVAELQWRLNIQAEEVKWAEALATYSLQMASEE